MRSDRSLLFLLLTACAVALTLLPQAALAQKRLSEAEMKNVIKLQDFRYDSGKRHECNYMEKPADSYSGGGTTDQYYLECCAGRRFPICGGRNADFKLRCCPGFVRFTDLDGGSKCNQRVLSDREAFLWLNEFRADSLELGGFVKAFVNTEQVGSVLMPEAPNNHTWTILAVADTAFKSADVTGLGSISKCGGGGGGATDGSGATSAAHAKAGKIAEGSEKHRALVYLQKCREQEQSSNASVVVDFRNEAWKHLIRGRKYVSDLQKEASVFSMYKTDSGDQYPLKFSRYSSGVACIECAPIVEANHEASNAVIHILGKSIMSKSKAVSLGGLVQARFPDFWSLLGEPERLLLGSSGCGAFYTVLVPKRLDELRGLSGERRAAAVREHIVKGLWCTAGMLDAETQPVATAAADSVKFACDASSRRLVRFGSAFRGQAVVSSSPGEFDVMATNGVLHVIDRAIIATSSLMTALQTDSAELLEEKATENLAAGLIRECSVKFQSDKGYILLLPTDEAFRKFFTRRAIPEAANFRDNQEVRCGLLGHHILETERDLTSLGRATHLQKTYRTLNGDRVADFLFVKDGALKIFFMNSEIVHGADGHEFINGHIYHVKEVLIPPSSQIWSRMIDTMYREQKRVISRFRSVVSRSQKSDRLMTLFLPKTSSDLLINLDTLRSHIADTVFYLSYLTGEVESIDLTALSGGKITIAREAGQYHVSIAGSSRKVLLHDCGVKVSVGIICSLEAPLVSPPFEATEP